MVRRSHSNWHFVFLAATFATSFAVLTPVLVADEDERSSGRVDMSAADPDPKEERVMLRFLGEGYKLRRSQHYAIIYNTSEEDVAVFQAAIEKTYRWCMRYCNSMNIPTHRPEKKLLTHFFDDFNDYAIYLGRTMGFGVSPNMLGVYIPNTNYTYFYNYRNMPMYKQARENAKFQIERLGEQLRRGDLSPETKKGIRNQIKQLRMIVNGTMSDGGEVTEATLQHEVAHQVLYNIGFHNPRFNTKQRINPRWFTEGMASLFEPISDGSAGGFGLINKERAGQYHQLVRADALFPFASFVSNNNWFNAEFNPGARAYPQAWAIAHYLTRNKRDELQNYIAALNARTGEEELTPEVELKTFEDSFGKVDEAFVERFLNYMEGIN